MILVHILESKMETKYIMGVKTVMSNKRSSSGLPVQRGILDGMQRLKAGLPFPSNTNINVAEHSEKADSFRNKFLSAPPAA